MSWDQVWYTIVGALALIGARLLDRWLPPHPTTTVVVQAQAPTQVDES